MQDWGGTAFEWADPEGKPTTGSTIWSVGDATSNHFAPSTAPFMINYRVENMEVLVEALKKEGVTIADKIETADYGKFVHILDVEGNKVELWEPNDIEYEKLGKQLGSKTTK